MCTLIFLTLIFSGPVTRAVWICNGGNNSRIVNIGTHPEPGHHVWGKEPEEGGHHHHSGEDEGTIHDVPGNHVGTGENGGNEGPSEGSYSYYRGIKYDCNYEANVPPLYIFMNHKTAEVEKSVGLIKHGAEVIKPHEFNFTRLMDEITNSKWLDKTWPNGFAETHMINVTEEVVRIPPETAAIVYQHKSECDLVDYSSRHPWTTTHGLVRLYLDVYTRLIALNSTCQDGITNFYDKYQNYYQKGIYRYQEAHNDSQNSMSVPVEHMEGLELSPSAARQDDKQEFLKWLNTKLAALNPSPFTELNWSKHLLTEYGTKQNNFILELPARRSGRAYQVIATCGTGWRPIKVLGWIFQVLYPHTDASWYSPDYKPECESPEFQPLCFTGHGKNPQSLARFLSKSKCYDSWTWITYNEREGDKLKVEHGMYASFFSQIDDNFRKAFLSKLHQMTVNDQTWFNWTIITEFSEKSKYPVEMKVAVQPIEVRGEVKQLIVNCTREIDEPTLRTGSYTLYTQMLAMTQNDPEFRTSCVNVTGVGVSVPLTCCDIGEDLLGCPRLPPKLRPSYEFEE